jgi:hypothetical protein
MDKYELYLFKEIFEKKKKLDYFVNDARERGLIGAHYIDILGLKVDIITLINQASEYHNGGEIKDFSEISKNDSFKKWFKSLQEKNKDNIEEKTTFEA